MQVNHPQLNPVGDHGGALEKVDEGMNELIFAPAAELAETIRRGRVSAREVVETRLRRIEAVNPRLNAVVQVRAEAALQEADAAAAALARGEIQGPLHGVPFTVKDNIDTAGVVTTTGTAGRAHYVPRQDAAVVARLRAAGAILPGKTNLPELGLAPETDNRVYGRTNNPYDVTRSAGGGSGGEAAIIAAGGSPLGLGNDSGGSLRIPAHCCGVASIKPTTGRVPKSIGDAPPPGGAWHRLWQHGPLARTVGDLWSALRVLAGPDGRDPSVVPLPLGDPANVELRGLRVAVYTDTPDVRADAQTATIVRAAGAALADAGAEVEEAQPPGTEQVYDLFFGLYGADGGALIEGLLESLGTTEPHPLTQQFLERARPYATSVTGLLRRLAGWDLWRGTVLAFMERYDALLVPNRGAPGPAPRCVARRGEHPRVRIRDSTQSDRLAGHRCSWRQITSGASGRRPGRCPRVARGRGPGRGPTDREG